MNAELKQFVAGRGVFASGEGACEAGVDEIRLGRQQHLLRGILHGQHRDLVISGLELGQDRVVYVGRAHHAVLQAKGEHHLGGVLIEGYSTLGSFEVGDDLAAVFNGHRAVGRRRCRRFDRGRGFHVGEGR